MAQDRVAPGVPAPGLLEVAQIWWDRDDAPMVTWDADGRVFTLVPEAGDAGDRLVLLELAASADDPVALARVLAEGLAACDFPPTGEQASPTRVAAPLRAARVEVTPTAAWGTD
jgi:hypothetical protein